MESESYPGPVNAVSRAAKIPGRSKGTESIIVKTWTGQLCDDSNEENSDRILIVASKRPGNRTPKSVRVTNAISVYREIRDFVRTKRAKHEQVTATEVLYFLESKNLITLNRDSSDLITQRERAAPVRNVQLWLLSNGFKGVKKNGKISLKPETIS